MRFDLTKPCVDCPWRVTGRTAKAGEVADPVQLAAHLADYECSASCHRTNEGHGVDDAAVEGEQYCAGAILAKMKRGISSSVLDDARARGVFRPERMSGAVEVL